MPRFFNTTGPCQEDIHYTLPPIERLPDLESLIRQRNYFVLHAPRQVGKTTAMAAVAQSLTASGNYADEGAGAIGGGFGAVGAGVGMADYFRSAIGDTRDLGTVVL